MVIGIETITLRIIYN